MTEHIYNDIVVTIEDRIGIIKFNRPQALNSFGGSLIPETISAIRHLNTHPDTIFTVLTGEGRFFCAGADVRNSNLSKPENLPNEAEKKLAYLARFSFGLEIMRSIIDHKKVFVLALNGPAVGAGAAWFPGIADIVLASPTTYLQIPFSALGLVPELGCATILAQSMGVHRANEFVMFGKKLNSDELVACGLVNRIFGIEGKDGIQGQVGFQEQVLGYLKEMLAINDGKSMMEAKRLQNAPLRNGRMLAVMEAVDALAERFVDGAPVERFEIRRRELEAKSKKRSSKM